MKEKEGGLRSCRERKSKRAMIRPEKSSKGGGGLQKKQGERRKRDIQRKEEKQGEKRGRLERNMIYNDF